MSKHISLFATESQYQAAKDNLDYPNVSLIDTTGDLHYATYTGKEVANAPFGSILMAEVATDKIFYILDSEYNLTDFPFADYKPIAVCIYDKASNANNETVFMSVQWADYSALGTPKASYKNMPWGFLNVNLSEKVSGIRDTGTNHISSIHINNEMKKLVTVDYSGQSVPNSYGDGESPAFCSCWRFKTPGVNEGKWYFPSYYDISKYSQNFSSILEVLTNIKNIAGSSYLNDLHAQSWIGSEYSNTNSYRMAANGTLNGNGAKNNNAAVRPVFIAGIEEL